MSKFEVKDPSFLEYRFVVEIYDHRGNLLLGPPQGWVRIDFGANPREVTLIRAAVYADVGNTPRRPAP